MSYLSFQYLDSLLAYLKGCVEESTVLGMNGDRGYLSQICLTAGEQGPSYYLPLREPKLGADVEHYEGKLVEEGEAPGIAESVNHLLRRLPLMAVPGEAKHLLSLVVVAPMSEYDTPSEARGRLYEAWRDIPRMAQGKSRFYLAQNAGQFLDWAVVHIEGVDPQFRVEEWLAKNKAPQVLLLVPPENCRGVSYLFVQWGYQYPKIQDFSLLYESGPNDYPLLLAMAGRPLAAQRLAGSDPTVAWFESVWYDVEVTPVARDHGLWNVEWAGPPSDVLMTVAPLEASVRVPLALADAHQLLGSIPELTRKIHRLEHELAVLNGKRHRLHDMMAYREYLPVYLFKEDADKPGLPPELTLFLNRSLKELSNCLYSAWLNEGVTVHCLRVTHPASLSMVLSVPCSQAFVQDVRWEKWGLQLFTQVGHVLNVDLEEREMADCVNALLQRAGVAEGQIVLAGPADDTDAPPLRLMIVPEQTAVIDNFAYINGVSDASEVLKADAIATHLVPVQQLEVEVTEDIKKAISELKEISQKRLAEAEALWENIRQKVRFVGLLASTGDRAIEVTREAYEAAPREWRSFLDKLLTLDASLAAGKDAAWAKFALEEESRRQRLDKLEQSYRRTIDELKTGEQHLQEVLNEQLQLQEEIVKEISRIQEMKAALRNELVTTENERLQLEAEVSAEQQVDRAFKTELQRVAKQQDELNEAMVAVERDRKQLAANAKRLEDDQQRLVTEQHQLKGVREKLDEDLQLHQKARRTYAFEKNDVDLALEKLERDRSILEEDRKRLLQAQRDIAEGRETLEGDRKKYNDDLVEVENDRRQLENDRATVGAADVAAKPAPVMTGILTGRPVVNRSTSGKTMPIATAIPIGTQVANKSLPGKTTPSRVVVPPSVRRETEKQKSGFPRIVAKLAGTWRQIWKKGS